MGCFCAVPEEFYCEVLLLDESKLTLTTQQQGIKKSTKGSIVLDHVFRHINLVEIDYFGLRYCDRSHQTYWLDPAKTLAEHKELINTGPPYTLYFGIKFYAEDPCKLKEEITRYQFFLQVKQDVLQGRLPCPVNIAAQLGAYAIQSELGDYDPYKHTSGYVSEYRFVPDQKEELEEAIERIHKTLMGQAPSEAELNYLRTAKSLEMYGVDLHPVYGENKSEYFLGLTPIGVVVYKNKKQVGKYFWPRITKVHFKETQFELRVLGKDVSQEGSHPSDDDGHALRNNSKCLHQPPKKLGSPSEGSNSINRITANLENGENEGTTKIIAPSPIKSGLYNSPSDRTKSPKFPYARRRNPSCGSDNDSLQPMRRRKAHNSGEDSDLKQRRRSRSRCNTSSGSESENSNREHRKKRNRIRQENDMVDSAPQWEAVLRRQKEKNQADPNNRRSRHRSRSTQGDPVRIRHSHSPRSYRQYRRSQCSDGERSVLSEVNSKTDLVPPLPVTRSSDAQGSGGSTVHQRRNGSKDSLIEDKSQTPTSNLAGKHTAKTIKTIQAARLKIET
ncbi:Band 4.1-like protein 4A [Sciurus carolinensis]|uniref:Band 4.1-like protein 4A n=1 Tax=Sciurus carolinensis TaxID=30640 RepID=A0AA41NAN9_SCICA|nr:Band 4.1-like protein 4A [Sciurus carolinensis]